MDYQDINAQTIDRWVEEGWEWGIPIDSETFKKAQRGEWDVVLTPHNSFVGDGNGQRLAKVILENISKAGE